ncbi:hypothetical protein H6G33_04155 [Calothrix sp. FACHB-1219]|uniref:hypothetical protein n=1 Tax=unclassified Calothrix TaxID=2619626 RepID=UPI001681CF89|nr:MULTISPECIES: hypothetical protein [unclassified Calothrix]MBD2204954.1 hypothetical protein [Calothrix sp. FACHB-168]MBD2216221.1 hypothetical protein [Calothrix sp. FACHB-1219]
MGFLARITQSNKSSEGGSNLATGGHAIDKNRVLAPTDPTAINPMNAGRWQSVRTAPINDRPRYFTKEEAAALKELAKQCTEGARQSQRAYRSLKKIETADAEVHKHHRNYVRGVADGELTKKRADVATARHLHRQRPEYARLGIGLENADNKAQQRIEELKAKIKAAK